MEMFMNSPKELSAKPDDDDKGDNKKKKRKLEDEATQNAKKALIKERLRTINEYLKGN